MLCHVLYVVNVYFDLTKMLLLLSESERWEAINNQTFGVISVMCPFCVGCNHTWTI